MKISRPLLGLILAIGLVSCARDDADRRDGPNAHRAGQEAYRAAQRAKRDLKEAERELRSAGKQFRDGWEEAKHSDKNRTDK